MPVIHLPTPLRPYADKQKQVRVKSLTVGEALAELTQTHPGLAPHLFGDDGKLRSFVNVYLNDEDVRHLQADATKLTPDCVLTIVPSIAGGVHKATP